MRMGIIGGLLALGGILSGGCSTSGVQSEARALAEAASRIDLSLRTANDIGIASDVARFTDAHSLEILTNDVCLGWIDASCDRMEETNEGRSVCEIGFFERVGDEQCPVASESAIFAARSLGRDLALSRFERESAHGAVALVFAQLARLAGAESTDRLNAYVQSTNAFGNAAIQANRSAAEHELDDYKKRTKDPDAATLEKLSKRVDDARLAATAGSASFDLTASIGQDLFAWRLAKKRRQYVARALGPLVRRKPGVEQAPIDALPARIAWQTDELMKSAHEYWQVRLSDEFEALQLLAMSAVKLELADDDPDAVDAITPEIREIPEWRAWQAQYDRFRLAREIVVQFEALQIAPAAAVVSATPPALREPEIPPVCAKSRAGIESKDYVSCLSALLREYGTSARLLRNVARGGKKSANATSALFDFDARAGAVLERLTRLDALIRKRIELDYGVRPRRDGLRTDHDNG